jgi:hypothetical protein
MLWVQNGEHLASTLFTGTVNSFCFDYTMRSRLGAVTITWQYLAESPIPRTLPAAFGGVVHRLNCSHESFAPEWLLKNAQGYWPGISWKRLWAISTHERLRLRCMTDAIAAALYGLCRDDFCWVLRDCDHAANHLSGKPFCRTLDAKGFWRIDKDKDPELRHTVLSLAAFDDLQKAIAATGSRDAGIEAWCAQNDGDGWMLPETLCLADLGLTRTVNVEYDDRSKTPQPVRSRMGERFLDWQLAQTPEESWAECERHAKALRAAAPAAPSAAAPTARPTAKRAKPVATKTSSQASLPGFEN